MAKQAAKHNKHHKPFADMVRQARVTKGLSQKQLGELLQTAQRPRGVYNTYVGQIEKGEKVPSVDVCTKLAEVLELDATELLLAAYEARAESSESSEARDLFRNMRHVLTDPVIKSLLETGESLDPEILQALTDDSIRGALVDAGWRKAISRCYPLRNKRNISELLAFVEVMNDKQWNGIMSMLEGMGLEPGQ